MLGCILCSRVYSYCFRFGSSCYRKYTYNRNSTEFNLAISSIRYRSSTTFKTYISDHISLLKKLFVIDINRIMTSINKTQNERSVGINVKLMYNVNVFHYKNDHDGAIYEGYRENKKLKK